MRQYVLAVLLGTVAMIHAVEPAQVPAGGTSLLAKPLAQWRFSKGGNPPATLTEIEVQGMPFAKAIRITHTLRPKQSWAIQLVGEVNAPIKRGDVCLMAFWLRSPQSADESGHGVVSPNVQQNFAPHTKSLSERVTAGKEWRQILLPFRPKKTLELGKANTGFHLGFHPQTVEIGGLQLLNYGTSRKLSELPRMRITYEGRKPDAPWRQEAAERIERFRKADLKVSVVDAQGRPVPGAEVKVAMRRHAFGFGTALTARLLALASPDGEAYRKVTKENYNKIVFENDLKWGPWRVSKDNKNRTFRQEWLDTALAWLAENEIPVRGHWLGWGSVTSGGQQRYVGKPVEHRRDLFAHIQEKVTAVGSRVAEWDAINHPVGWGVTYEQLHGGLDFHVDIFRHARKTAPEGIGMWINEGQILPGGSRRGDYERIIIYLIDHGQAPDGVGFMGHFSRSSLTAIPELYGVYDRYAKLVPKLQITEFDVNVGGDEQLQADYLRDFMTVTFSHPSVDAIVMWGFWAGKHWKPDAALYRKDWSLKPAGQAWLDLVQKQWWTNHTGQTDAAGSHALRAFLGRHEITVSHDGTTKTAVLDLPKVGKTVGIRLR
jgi:endo-1,4-beta-xylanase